MKKNYTLKLEVEAVSYRDLLYNVIDVLGEINAHEYVVTENGFTGNSNNSNGSTYHFDIDVAPTSE